MIPDSTTSFVEDLANAPGTLPAPQVEERLRAQAHQFRHDNTIDPPVPAPTDTVTIWATSGSAVRLDRATVYMTFDGSVPTVRSFALPMTLARVDWDVRTGYLSRWRAEVPAQPAGTRVRYRIGGWRVGTDPERSEAPGLWAHDGQGFWFRDQGDTGISLFAYAVQPPQRPCPHWMDTATIYHIFLDRFHPGAPDGAFTGSTGARELHGGTLHGVHASLPYLSDLGVTCLWLSPLHPAETYHRYDTLDFFSVDPRLGTTEDLQALVREAHRRGIRVILDFVPSHLSWHHPAFLAAQHDQNAPSAGWFTFHEWPHAYRSFLNLSRYLPSIDTRDPGAQRHLIESAVYWLRDVGVDGFRLDHAIGPGMDFWVAFRAAVAEARPDAVMIGEVTDTPDSLKRYRGRLHAILDFELAAALRFAYGRGGWGVGRLESFIASYDRFMADGPGRVSFLDNHDMDRFLWLAGNDTTGLKLAALCQFTLTPTPVVYYGTEIGMSQRMGAHDPGSDGDAEARRDMIWDRGQWNHDVLGFYRALIRARRDHALLARGSRRTIALDDAAGVWGYIRGDGDRPPGAGDLLVLFNLGNEWARVDMPPVWRGFTPRALVTAGDFEVTAGGCTVGPRAGGLVALE